MESRPAHRPRGTSHKCPHCKSPFQIRSSEQETPLLRRLWGQCQNVHCGFTAQGFFSWDAELSPSAMPNPNISLPRTKAATQQKGAACV